MSPVSPVFYTKDTVRLLLKYPQTTSQTSKETKWANCQSLPEDRLKAFNYLKES